jgi:hypothetical protein
MIILKLRPLTIDEQRREDSGEVCERMGILWSSQDSFYFFSRAMVVLFLSSVGSTVGV